MTMASPRRVLPGLWVGLLANVLLLTATALSAAEKPSRVVLVTLDGLRWQELFAGADVRLMNEDAGVKNPAELRKRYERDSAQESRQALMPFFWSTIAVEGQVLGSPDHESTVTVTNQRHFSYPGYNEILTGFADPKIASNDKVPNQNTTVLEWLNRQSDFHDRVAAFASWDVFPFIINQSRSGVYVNAGWQPLDFARTQTALQTLNGISSELPKYWDSVRYDTLTFRGAIEYLHIKRPKVLYLALGETDDWAHAGRYDLYLDAARQSDEFLRQLWVTLQSIDEYRGQTSLVITTDHGRGEGREAWKSHSVTIPGCDRIWIAALGPGVPPLGVREKVQATQAQVAPTVAALLGLDFTAVDRRIAQPLPLRKGPRN